MANKSIRKGDPFMEHYYARELAIQYAEVIALDMGLEYIRTVPAIELARMTQRTPPLTGELKDFVRADIVIEGTDSETVQYIAVETAFTASYRCASRALRNAELLAEFTGLPARAAIASIAYEDSISGLITSGTLYWLEFDEHQFY